ncbi:mycothiol transferase [Streptomyces milbemycinicus]|uniref:DUF664 domain-containing protein n=1 Tax=Streptomyces milbemycinicus TaxID=476552 RepID=A0ABW8LBP4_9ACTN
MNSADVLADAFGRVQETVHGAVKGLTVDQLAARLDDKANSVAWLVWHLTRVQDDHVSEVAAAEEVWTEQGWYERFELPFPAAATGYGHRAKDVAALRVPPKLLLGYYDAVHERTIDYVRGLRDADLAAVVDEAWTPPVTLGVRLVSVISDDLLHAGQAAFIRGVLLRRR